MNTLFYQNMYLSHFMLDVSVVCERWVETGTDFYIDPTSLDHSSTSSASWFELLNWGSLRATVCKLALTLAFLSPTNSTAPGTCLYSFIMPMCFRFFFCLCTPVHLWLTAWSRVNIQQYAVKQTNCIKKILSHTHTHTQRLYIYLKLS